MTAKIRILRSDIQILRALAVVAVIFYHAKSDYFPLGYLGVDIFFVISGFVITPLIVDIFDKGKNSTEIKSNMISFFRKRFYRLAPAFGSLLIISTTIIYFFGPIGDHKRFSLQGLFSIFLIGNIGAYKYSGNYFYASPNPLVHTWSLSLEEQIYILLPIFLALGYLVGIPLKKYINQIYLFLTIFSLALFELPQLTHFVYASFPFERITEVNFYSPISRFWEFGIGGIIYLVKSKGLKKNTSPNKFLQLIPAAWVMLIFLPIKIVPPFASLQICIAVAGAIHFESFKRLKIPLMKIGLWVGNRSYSIYLWHMPLLYLAKYSRVFEISMINSRAPQTMLAIFASIVTGGISYKHIESKFRLKDDSAKIAIRKSVKSTVVFLVIPILLLSLTIVSYDNNYWFMNRNPKPPTFAVELDKKCNRESLYLDPPCSYPTIGSRKSVLLIGDSHAAQFSEAIPEAAKMNRWDAYVWTHSGCPIVFSGRATNLIDLQCASANKRMLNWVSAKKPDLVIVSQFVHSNFSQLDLRAGITELLNLGQKIVMIENTPVFPDLEYMVPRPLLLSEYKAPRKIRIEDMNNSDIRASKKLAKWARLKGVNVININKLYCDSNYCNRWGNGKWFYTDVGHLSVEGANLAIPLFSKLLSRA